MRESKERCLHRFTGSGTSHLYSYIKDNTHVSATRYIHTGLFSSSSAVLAMQDLLNLLTFQRFSVNSAINNI